MVVLVVFLLFIVFVYVVDEGFGEIYFKGEVIEVFCEIYLEDIDKNIDFG